jgi:hypothetical protein
MAGLLPPRAPTGLIPVTPRSVPGPVQRQICCSVLLFSCFSHLPQTLAARPATNPPLQEVASALRYCHRRGVLHGDLTAGNVLLVSGRCHGAGGRDHRDFVAKVIRPRPCTVLVLHVVGGQAGLSCCSPCPPS